MQTDVLLSPLELSDLSSRDLTQTTCVVFDILRATTVMVTALANSAIGIRPVLDIPSALVAKACFPDALLAGERHGLRITRELTGSVDFDLGNSPREFTRERVQGRRIISTTTNGTRALNACRGAQTVLAASFANLEATATHLTSQRPQQLLLIASGTGDHPAYEDLLAVGALCELLEQTAPLNSVSDSVQATQRLFREVRHRVPEALGEASNGRRLLMIPALAPDVALCGQLNTLPLIARLSPDGWLETLRTSPT